MESPAIQGGKSKLPPPKSKTPPIPLYTSQSQTNKKQPKLESKQGPQGRASRAVQLRQNSFSVSKEPASLSCPSKVWAEGALPEACKRREEGDRTDPPPPKETLTEGSLSRSQKKKYLKLPGEQHGYICMTTQRCRKAKWDKSLF